MFKFARRKPSRLHIDLETVRETLLYIESDCRDYPGLESVAAALAVTLAEIDRVQDRIEETAARRGHLGELRPRRALGSFETSGVRREKAVGHVPAAFLFGAMGVRPPSPSRGRRSGEPQFHASGDYLELHLDAAIGRERQGRSDAARIGGIIITCGLEGCRRLFGVEEGAIETISPIEGVLDQAVELNVLADVVGGRKIDARVAGELRVVVGFVAEKELARRSDEIGADLPLRRQPVLNACFEAMLRNARADGRRSETKLQLISSAGSVPVQGSAPGVLGAGNSSALRNVASTSE